MKGVEQGRRNLDAHRLGRTAVLRMAQEVRAAMHDDAYAGFTHGENAHEGDYARDRLTFVTVPYRPATAPGSDVCEVAYYIGANAQGAAALYREQDCTPDGEPLNGDTIELTDAAVGLDVTYYDREESYDKWPDRAANRLPCLVRLVLTLSDEEATERAFITTVSLPMSKDGAAAPSTCSSPRRGGSGPEIKRLAGADERGVALVLTLIIVALVSVLVLEYHFEAVVELDLADNYGSDVQAYHVAMSGLRLAQELLAYDDEQSDGPQDSWHRVGLIPACMPPQTFLMLAMADTAGASLGAGMARAGNGFGRRCPGRPRQGLRQPEHRARRGTAAGQRAHAGCPPGQCQRGADRGSGTHAGGLGGRIRDIVHPIDGIDSSAARCPDRLARRQRPDADRPRTQPGAGLRPREREQALPICHGLRKPAARRRKAWITRK